MIDRENKVTKPDEVAIKVSHLFKSFKLPHEKNTSVKSSVVRPFKKRAFEKQEVLKDIDFEIKKGEFFGIVGRNGSGKSTLLKIIAGVYSPTKGSVQIKGKLVPFIELGVGFNAELSGRDNLFLNGALLGFNRKEMIAMYDEIVSFAELEEHMDAKLKNFSSGMQVRLAFSIAIRAKSDILLIDEVLAVGDAAFQTKCFDYFYQLKKKGATVIFVSHDRNSLERFCDKGVLIDEGVVTSSGSISKILKVYSEVVLKELEHAEALKGDKEAEVVETVSDYASIENVVTLDSRDTIKKRFVQGSDIIVRYEVKIRKELTNPIFGVTIWQKHLDKPVYATNTLIESKRTGTFNKDSSLVFSILLPSSLNDGEYYIEPAIANESGAIFYDHISKAASFFVSGSSNPYSIITGSELIKIEKSTENND